MNPNLPRLKPNPIPKIAPISEHLAEPALKEIYEDTKAALQVPWMGVVAMSFTRYRRFYATLWGGFRELSASAQFLAAPSRAYGDAPWCAVFTIAGGGIYWNCQYRTIAECVPNVIGGTRGFCNLNPWPGPYGAAGYALHKRHARQN